MAAKSFPESKEVWRGHGRKIKSGLQSTKQPVLEKEADPLTSEGERALLLQTYNLQHEVDKGLYTDQTGRFPYTSFEGNQYMMVAYDMHGSNAVLAEPMRN